MGGNSSFLISRQGEKETVSVKVRIKASATIPSPNQTLGWSLKFNYNNNISLVQLHNDKISIPALAREMCPSRWWWSPLPHGYAHVAGGDPGDHPVLCQYQRGTAHLPGGDHDPPQRPWC